MPSGASSAGDCTPAQTTTASKRSAWLAPVARRVEGAAASSGSTAAPKQKRAPRVSAASRRMTANWRQLPTSSWGR